MQLTTQTRFPIRFDAAYRVLSTALLIRPSESFVEVEGEKVRVRMAWAFEAEFPMSAVRSVTDCDRTPLSRGAHGWGGRLARERLGQLPRGERQGKPEEDVAELTEEDIERFQAMLAEAPAEPTPPPKPGTPREFTEVELLEYIEGDCEPPLPRRQARWGAPRDVELTPSSTKSRRRRSRAGPH